MAHQPVRLIYSFNYQADVLGGLVVIDMFLLQWSVTESIQRFEQVARETFGERKPVLSRTLQLIKGYMEDGQYNLDAVQDAFRKTFNSSFQMFNPLRNDTKVSVTITAVADSLPWLFTNYNGGKRPPDLGIYFVLRKLLHLTLRKVITSCVQRRHIMILL